MLTNKKIKDGLKLNKFVLHYQPQYDIKENKIIGAEALIRYQDNDKLIYPNMFIPALERESSHETMIELDLYALEKVCIEINKLKMNHIYGLKMSCNVSINSVCSDLYVKTAEELFSRYCLKKGDINVEITETIMCKDTDKLLKSLNHLKSIGYLFGIDDFGVSPFYYITLIPASTLKLDKLFFSGMFNNGIVITKVLSQIINMARTLGMEVIAEGIETQEQVELLKEIDCKYAQGYYYNKPLPETLFFNEIKAISI